MQTLSRAGLLFAGFQSWRQGTCLTELTSWVFTGPLPQAGRGRGHSQHGMKQGESEGQHPGGRAVYTLGWQKAALCTPLLWKPTEGQTASSGAAVSASLHSGLLLLQNTLLDILPTYDWQC